MKKFIKMFVVAIVLLPCFLFSGCALFRPMPVSSSSSSSSSQSSSSSGGSGNSGGGSQSASNVTVTLNLKGGSGVSKLSYTGSKGSTLDLPTPTYPGATFEGWYNGKTKVTNDDVFPSSSQTWTAKYTLNSSKNCSIDAESPSVMSTTSMYRYLKTSHFDADELILFESMLQYCSQANVSCSFESMAGGSYKINLQGANELPDIASATYNDTSYTKHTINTTAGVGLFQPKADGTFFALTKLMSSGITVREIKVTLTFTLPAGALI